MGEMLINPGALQTLVKVKAVLTSAESIASGSFSDIKQTPSGLAETGYTPIGVVGWSISGTGRTAQRITRCYYDSDNNQLCATIKNENSATISDLVVTFYVLYIRNIN